MTYAQLVALAEVEQAVNTPPSDRSGRPAERGTVGDLMAMHALQGGV